SASGARRNRLHRPAVAVGIAEEDELAPRELLDLADLHTPRGQFVVCGLDVADDHLHTLHGAWRSLCDTFADDNGTGRSWRSQLYEAQSFAHRIVVVGVEARLLGVEALGAVNVGHGNRHEFNLPVHA